MARETHISGSRSEIYCYIAFMYDASILQGLLALTYWSLMLLLMLLTALVLKEARNNLH